MMPLRWMVMVMVMVPMIGDDEVSESAGNEDA